MSMSTGSSLSSHLIPLMPHHNNLMWHHSQNNNLNLQKNSPGIKLSAKRRNRNSLRRINLFQKLGGEDQEKTQVPQKTKSSRWSLEGRACARQMEQNQQVNPSQCAQEIKNQCAQEECTQKNPSQRSQMDPAQIEELIKTNNIAALGGLLN
jgi:hypothetical protein